MSFTGTSSITMAAGVSIGSSGNNVFSGTNTFSGTLDVDACLEDSLGSCGVAGQVLISTGTAVQWSTGAGLGAQNLQGVLDTAPFGATGANANVVISGTLNAGTITDNSGSTGAVGQYLAISGAGLTWTTAGWLEQSFEREKLTVYPFGVNKWGIETVKTPEDLSGTL